MRVSVEGASPPPGRGAFAGLFELAANLGKADARWLVLLPLGIGLVFGLLLLPWSPKPDGVPLPVPDRLALERAADADRALAERARSQPLPGAVRALGSALRAYHTIEAHLEVEPDEAGLASARAGIDRELGDAFRAGDDALLALRAVELEGFLVEADRFERTGQVSPELEALAGTFVASMTRQGWCVGHTIVAPSPVLRVMFKEMWNGFVGVQGRPAFEPTLDEMRALFAFYLAHPHAPTNARDQAAAMRRGAHGAQGCEAADRLERRALEKWRLARIARIAAIDPTYPAAYARGVASFGAGAYEASAEAFRAWLQSHPEGPYTLRAQGFLRAAVAAARID
jgi:hypothetical protein